MDTKVYVIIPNKNGLSHLAYSLPSLINTSYSNYHCILVDNNSTDESISFVQSNFKTIQVLENKNGKGFASSVNMGIKYALEQGADYIAIYNSDIKVLPQWITVAIDIFNNNGKAGLVGYTEITRENEELFYSSNKPKVEYTEVKSLSGCLFICPSQVFKRIGLFDEKYFMYGEDNDFFARSLKAGYLILQMNVLVWHYGEGSSQGKKIMPTWLAYRNALRFSIKNESPVRVMRMLLALINQGCNPFLKRSVDLVAFKRMRRFNPLFNVVIIIGSCFWNLYHIGSTMKARREVKKHLMDMH